MKKAQEYYDFYHERLYNPTTPDDKRTEIGKCIFLDFCDDARELIKKRNMKTDEAALGLIKELNDKWNAMVRIFEKHYGFSFFIKDGFKIYWAEHGIKLI